MDTPDRETIASLLGENTGTFSTKLCNIIS